MSLPDTLQILFWVAFSLIAGFWVWQVKSKQEAIESARRCPADPGTGAELEIRQEFELADFAAEMTPVLREQESRLRAEFEAHLH